MVIFLIILLMFIALAALLQGASLYGVAHLFGYRMVTFRQSVSVGILAGLSGGVVGTLLLLIVPGVVSLAVSFVTSFLVFQQLFVKKFGGTRWRATSVYVLQTIALVVAWVTFVVLFRSTIIQPFVVSGSSMNPTYHQGDYLFVNMFSRDFVRGDVVVFRYPKDRQKVFIQRIIGLPGEEVVLDKGVVSVRTKGGGQPQVLEEPYVATEQVTDDSVAVILGPDEYFMLGDNRAHSIDSRVWGPVAEREIIGEVWVRVFEGWPTERER